MIATGTGASRSCPSETYARLVGIRPRNVGERYLEIETQEVFLDLGRGQCSRDGLQVFPTSDKDVDGHGVFGLPRSVRTADKLVDAFGIGRARRDEVVGPILLEVPPFEVRRDRRDDRPRGVFDERTRTVDGEALFPAEYLRRTLAAAHNDEKMFRAKVFDGSGQGTPVLDASTVIGKPSTAPATEKALKIQQLEGLRHWPVTVSYFQPDAPDSTPLYVKTYELYENGVVHVLKIDYGHLVVAGEMKELVLAPPAKACK